MNTIEADNNYGHLKLEERRLHKSGDYLQAVDVVNQILALRPILGDTIITWLWLRRRALAWERAGAHAEALDDYRRAMQAAEEFRASGRALTPKWEDWVAVIVKKVETLGREVGEK
jgi:tetratricopeptide (TPR) repeat protein